jgi:hypothetical protein
MHKKILDARIVCLYALGERLGNYVACYLFLIGFGQITSGRQVNYGAFFKVSRPGVFDGSVGS